MAVGPMENGKVNISQSVAMATVISNVQVFWLEQQMVPEEPDEASMFQLIKSNGVTSYPNPNLHDGCQRTAIHLIEHIKS